jgi:hypothetical protein
VCACVEGSRKRNDIAPPACHCPQCVHMQNAPARPASSSPIWTTSPSLVAQRGGRIGAVQNSPCRPDPGSQVKNGYAAALTHMQSHKLDFKPAAKWRDDTREFILTTLVCCCEIVFMNVAFKINCVHLNHFYCSYKLHIVTAKGFIISLDFFVIIWLNMAGIMLWKFLYIFKTRHKITLWTNIVCTIF